VAGPALQVLQTEPEKASRTRQLTNLLFEQRYTLAELAFEKLAPDQTKMDSEPARPPRNRETAQAPNRNDDTIDTQWELVTWLLEGMMVRDFPQQKTVKPGQGAPVPHYLYRLAQLLASSCDGWQTPNAVKCLQAVLFELSAEHTREKLQAHYGVTVGDDDSINHITKVLRPVDRHQNGALHLLKNGRSLAEPAALVVGAPYLEEEFRIRQVVKRWQIPVPWLMNWTQHLPAIQVAVQGHPLFETLSETDMEGDATQAAKSKRSLGKPLSGNKDVYLGTEANTVLKLERVLQQLKDLHHLGGPASAHQDMEVLLERLDADALGSAHNEPRRETADTPTDTAAEATRDNVMAVLDEVQHRFVRVAVMLRLLKRETHKARRTKLGDDLVQGWAEPGENEQGLFDRLHVKPGIKGLTDAVLAEASSLSLGAFRQQVDEAVARFDTADALATAKAQADKKATS